MGRLNLLDVIITLLAVGACLGGFRLGFVARSAAWLGMVGGVVVGARLAPVAVDRFAEGAPERILVVTAITLIVCAFVGQLIGQLLGLRVRVTARGGRVEQADRVLGAATGIAAVLVTVWLLAPALTDAGEWTAAQARDSRLVRAIEDLTPDAPDVSEAAGRLVGQERWDRLIETITADRTVAPPPDDLAIADDLRTLLAQTTVKVSNQSCRDDLAGTGFVFGPGLVFTNAHVVAGANDPVEVEFHHDGREFEGEVVYFDPQKDIAVIRFGGTDRPSLELAASSSEGDQGWIYGHRGGGAPRLRTFEVHHRKVYPLPDIYHSNMAGVASYERLILLLAADLAGGDSGSALVSTTGQVVGMAFAVATDDDHPDVALAISVEELQEARSLVPPEGERADAGACFATR